MVYVRNVCVCVFFSSLVYLNRELQWHSLDSSWPQFDTFPSIHYIEWTINFVWFSCLFEGVGLGILEHWRTRSRVRNGKLFETFVRRSKGKFGWYHIFSRSFYSSLFSLVVFFDILFFAIRTRTMYHPKGGNGKSKEQQHMLSHTLLCL